MRAARGATQARDLVCLSHLRWNFVYQRPQHLLSRAALSRRVFYIEEPGSEESVARLETHQDLPQLWVIVPHLPRDLDDVARNRLVGELLNDFFAEYGIEDYVLWFYTPAALLYARHLTPAVSVYDCMDELSLFKGASSTLAQLENELFARVDLVFTGGQSLYEAKRQRHPDVHLFPSSIDRSHFAKARKEQADPPDQAAVPHPRLGFFGVIDERMDLALVGDVARAQPDWQIILLGPIAKIDQADIPNLDNVHYLGPKSYAQLPGYLAGWDVAIMPFAHNDATRFISPTKTPEYLAGGKPVVSTGIRDVVRPYGELQLVAIAEGASGFVNAVEIILRTGPQARAAWWDDVDGFLSRNSWDLTWSRMESLIEACAGTTYEARERDTEVS